MRRTTERHLSPVLDGAVAVVTGASGGLGAAIVEALARRGVTVVATGRDQSALDRLVARTGCTAVACDLREPGASAQLVSRVLDEHGRVDIVVANAGVGWAGDLGDMPVDRLRELVEVNVTAPLELARAALPSMLARGSGRLVFVSSIAGAVGVPGETVYSATKAAVEMFADVLRAEVVGTGVQVGTVRPGVVRTEFFARRGLPYDRRFPRPMPPERVAEAVVDLIVSGRATVVLPRWLSVPIRLRAVAPGLYRALERRFG